MEAKLGNIVITKTHNHKGRVCSKHHNFSYVNETDDWFNCLKPALDESTKSEPWYSILTSGGGSVAVPESEIISVSKEVDPDFNNVWADFYFDD